MIGVVDRAATFFSAHSKRQLALESAIAVHQPESATSKLKDLCRTRWVQRIDALNNFQSLHPSLVLVACVETICTEGRSKNGLLTQSQMLEVYCLLSPLLTSLVHWSSPIIALSICKH